MNENNESPALDLLESMFGLSDDSGKENTSIEQHTDTKHRNIDDEPFIPAPPIKMPSNKKRGRPKTLSIKDRIATQVFLSQEERDLASSLGNGKISIGVRFALYEAQKSLTTDDPR